MQEKVSLAWVSWGKQEGGFSFFLELLRCFKKVIFYEFRFIYFLLNKHVLGVRSYCKYFKYINSLDPCNSLGHSSWSNSDDLSLGPYLCSISKLCSWFLQKHILMRCIHLCTDKFFFCVSMLICSHMHMNIYVNKHMHVHMYACMCGGKKSCQISSSIAVYSSFWDRVSLTLELIDLAKLAT